MEKEMIKIDHLVKSFGDHHVLKDITLSFNRGEVVSIIGSSGSGKSTLLRSINLLEEPTSGDIIIDGKSVDVGKYLSDNPDGLEKFKEVVKEYFDEERQRLLASLENNYCNSKYDYEEVDD